MKERTCILVECTFMCTDSQDCAGAGMCAWVASTCKVSTGEVEDGTQRNDSPTICAGLAHSSSLPGTAEAGRAKASGRGGQSKERFVD